MLREQPTDQLKDKTDRPALQLKSRGLNNTNHLIADTSNVWEFGNQRKPIKSIN